MRLKSGVDETQVVVLRAGPSELAVSCGGYPMHGLDDEVPVGLLADRALLSGTLLGKRYQDDESMIELLCVKAGEGTLMVDGRPMAPKDAKPLPSSD
jgi:hypothetical protein